MAARRTTGAAAGRDSKVRSRAGGEEKAPAQAEGSGGMGFVDAITIATNASGRGVPLGIVPEHRTRGRGPTCGRRRPR